MKKTVKEPPLVLLHGYPFDHTIWYATIASIGSAAKVLAPDLPGFGKMDVLHGEPSLEAMADYVATRLDEYEVKSAIVAGMSMGGYVALAFAEKYPRRLEGLGLISTQTAADSDEARGARQEMIRKIASEGSLVAAEAITPKLFMKNRTPPPDFLAAPRKGAEAAGAAGLTYALAAMAKRPDRTALARDLDVPVLVVHGTDDQIIPLPKAKTLAEQCLDPIFVPLKAGHVTPLEAPDGLAQALVRLVRRVREVREEKLKPVEAA